MDIAFLKSNIESLVLNVANPILIFTIKTYLTFFLFCKYMDNGVVVLNIIFVERMRTVFVLYRTIAEQINLNGS